MLKRFHIQNLHYTLNHRINLKSMNTLSYKVRSLKKKKLEAHLVKENIYFS